MAGQTTRWSLILKAAEGDSAEAALALALLCEAYWYPVYAFVRRQGYSPPDAEDLTQGYFARFLEKGVVREVRPESGRFRSFLVVSVRNFLHNERDRERALKRGGGPRLVSLDVVAAEREYEHEPVDAATPESLLRRPQLDGDWYGRGGFGRRLFLGGLSTTTKDPPTTKDRFLLRKIAFSPLGSAMVEL